MIYNCCIYRRPPRPPSQRGDAALSCPLALRKGGSSLADHDPTGFPAPWSVHELERAFVVADATGQAVAYTYFRKDENEAGRRMCSRTTRPGGLQPTSPSCPSCYPTRPRNDLSPVPRDHRRRRAPELAGNAGERESAEPTVKHSEIPNRLYPRRCGREVIHCLLNYHHAKENFLLRVVAWLALFTIPPILGFPLT